MIWGELTTNQENKIIEVEIQSIQFKLNNKGKEKSLCNLKINWETTYLFSMIEAQLI